MDGPRDYHTEWSRTERQISWYCLKVGFLGGTSGKELICQCRRHKRGGFDPWVRKIPCRRIPACPSSLSITNCWSLLKLMPIESVMPSSHLILCCPLLLLTPIPPSIRSFPLSQLFAWGGQCIGVSASASVLPRNTQDLSPSGWTGWISLQSKGLSRVFFNTTVQKHQFFGAQLSSQSNSHMHTWPLEKP